MLSLAKLLGGLCVGLTIQGFAFAAGFTPGNLAVYRVGDGAAALVNTGAKVFLDEYTTAGTLVQSIELNSTGSANKLVASGTATSEGLLTISPNGQFLTLAGYNSTIPLTGLSGTTGTVVPRTVGIVTVSTGAVDLSTALSDFASGNNPRAAVTDDGVNLWLAGGAGGLRYATKGSTTSTQIASVPSNFRQVNIFGGQLYATSQSTNGGNSASIGTIGSGLPTATSQTFTTLPGLSGVAGTNKYSFFLADLSTTEAGLDTLYVADEDAAALTKYSLVSSNWTSNGVVGTTSDNFRSLTGFVDTTGQVNLFFSRSATGTGSQLMSLTDTTGYNGAFSGTPTQIAVQATGSNKEFRGIAYVPNTGGGLSGIAGDYDNSTVVNALDYTKWKDNFGEAITTLKNANPTREAGPVDASDYTYWRDRVPSGGAVANAAAVPEPMALLLVLPLVGLALRRRK